jgi:glycosyltransferase involved in cell wall biosynthesis
MDRNRIRLLLIDSATTLGSEQRTLWELATRLPPSRYEVCVWLSATSGADDLARSLAARGVVVERLSCSCRGWRARFDLWRRLRQIRPALLHVHLRSADPWWLEPRIAREAQLVVSTSIGAGAEMKLEPIPWLNRAEAVVVPLRSLIEPLVLEGGVERDRVHVVPFGVDLADEASEAPAARKLRARLGAGPFCPLWYCPAPCEPRLGHEVFLHALAEICRRDLRFVAVLSSVGELREELERTADHMGLRERVHFLDPSDHQGAILLAADLVVFPFEIPRYSHALLHALARARPVVASAIRPIPELIEDHLEGRLVPGGDPQALADILEWSHRCSHAAQALGKAGRERVRAEYSWTQVIERNEAVYDEVLGLASFAAMNAPARGTSYV